MMKKLRRMVQIAFTIATNGYAYGFLHGKIYQGSLKYACVPGLNCYSCPGAIGSCPLGALQALFNQQGFQVPFAVLGVFFLFGSLLGRFVCGWLCPFGLVQDLLYKIPLFSKRKRLPFHQQLKFGKYISLALFVGLGSMFLWKGFAKVPAFCKYLCPSGTLLGAVPLLAANPLLRSQAGGLFFWKLSLLFTILILSVKVYRPFCQYLCPLGAIYGWFNRFSLVQVHWEGESCIMCRTCEKACPLALSVKEISTSPECIRCKKCIEACPEKCLHLTLSGKSSASKPQTSFAKCTGQEIKSGDKER